MQKQSHSASEASELKTQLLQEESILGLEENVWLSEQFDRLPHKLYRYWLMLGFAIVLTIIPLSARITWIKTKEVKENQNYVGYLILFVLHITLFTIGCLLLLSGSREILSAMTNKKSKIAQKGFLKFQYSIMSSAANYIIMEMFREDVFNINFVEILPIDTILGSLVMIHLIGGSAVLRVFRNNHPLVRPLASQTLEEDVDTDLVAKDFRAQNEAIASKLLEYDKQLNTCGYVVFRWWLKLAIVLETICTCFKIVGFIFVILGMAQASSLIQEVGFAILSFQFLLRAWSFLQTGVALTTKSLQKLERVIFLLKVCIIISIITCAVFELYGIVYYAIISRIIGDTDLSYFLSCVCCCLPPILTLIGALKAKKILQEREKYAKVLTFNDEAYL